MGLLAPRDTVLARFQPANILEQAMIQEIAVSPDGATVVYSRRVVVRGRYQKHLWEVPYGGGRARALTRGVAKNSQPRFSPDGRSILYLSDRTGSIQPWILPLRGGLAHQLASFPGSVRAAEWSPDGTRVLVIAPSGDPRNSIGETADPTALRITDLTWRADAVGIRDQFYSAYVVSSSGGDPVRVTDSRFEVANAFWAPDGATVGFLADLRPEAALGELPQVWSLPTEGQGVAPTQLVSVAGEIQAACWSRSGTLAVIGTEHPGAPLWANHNLYLVAGDELAQLGADLDRSFRNVTFGDLIDPEAREAITWIDDRSLVVIVGDQGASHPYRLSVDGDVERLAGGDIVCTTAAAAGGHLIVVATNRGQPGEVYAIEKGTLRQLTTNGSSWLAPYRRDPERVLIPTSGRATIDAWLVCAEGSPRPGPLIVQIHGGPHGAHGPTPWLEMLALASAGFQVLYPNPHGSAGYGEAFTRSVHGAFGDLDSVDILALVEWAIDRGIADRRRILVVGLSYGGFMTTWLLGHHPGIFAAGVSENPVTDLISWFGSSDLVMATGVRFVGAGTVPENLDRLLEHSPYLSIHRNAAPLLLLQSESDLRCPPNQSELVFAILRSRGKPVEMVRYPDESHFLVGIGRPDRRLDRMERIVNWFARYL